MASQAGDEGMCSRNDSKTFFIYIWNTLRLCSCAHTFSHSFTVPLLSTLRSLSLDEIGHTAFLPPQAATECNDFIDIPLCAGREIRINIYTRKIKVADPFRHHTKSHTLRSRGHPNRKRFRSFGVCFEFAAEMILPFKFESNVIELERTIETWRTEWKWRGCNLEVMGLEVNKKLRFLTTYIRLVLDTATNCVWVDKHLQSQPDGQSNGFLWTTSDAAVLPTNPSRFSQHAKYKQLINLIALYKYPRGASAAAYFFVLFCCIIQTNIRIE